MHYKSSLSYLCTHSTEHTAMRTHTLHAACISVPFNVFLHHIFMRYAHTRSHTRCDNKAAEEVKNPFLIKHRSNEILIVNKLHCMVLLSGQHSSVVVSTVASQQECNGFKSKLGPFCGDSMFSPVPPWVLSSYSGFRPQSNDILRLICDSKSV